jgi:hypothetical protein
MSFVEAKEKVGIDIDSDDAVVAGERDGPCTWDINLNTSSPAKHHLSFFLSFSPSILTPHNS